MRGEALRWIGGALLLALLILLAAALFGPDAQELSQRYSVL